MYTQRNVLSSGTLLFLCAVLQAHAMPQKNVNLRLPDSLTARADALVARMQADPALSVAGSITASSVLRAAIAEGLAVLERRYAPSDLTAPGGS